MCDRDVCGLGADYRWGGDLFGFVAANYEQTPAQTESESEAVWDSERVIHEHVRLRSEERTLPRGVIHITDEL